MSKEINVEAVLGGTIAVTKEKGIELFNVLCEVIDYSLCERIYLDFSNIDLITYSFLSECIGVNLFRKYGYEHVVRYIQISSVKTWSDLDLFRLVLAQAMKEFREETHEI